MMRAATKALALPGGPTPSACTLFSAADYAYFVSFVFSCRHPRSFCPQAVACRRIKRPGNLEEKGRLQQLIVVERAAI